MFSKSLESLETCVLVSNNLWKQLVSLLELSVILDERFKVTSIPVFFLI